MNRIARQAVVLAMTVLTLGALSGFSPPVGSEFMVTDADGRRLVGTGTVGDSEVSFTLSERVDRVRVIVVTPDGEVRTYPGTVRNGRLFLDEEGEEIDVADALAPAGMRLRLIWPDETIVLDDVAPSDPDGSATPDAPPQGDEGDEEPGDDLATPTLPTEGDSPVDPDEPIDLDEPLQPPEPDVEDTL